MPQRIKSISQNKPEERSFQGFSEGKHRQVPLYDEFFENLLPLIDDLDELKITLYCFWKLDQMEGVFRCIRLSEAAADRQIFSQYEDPTYDRILKAFELAVQRGTLLEATSEKDEHRERLFFLNSPRGRAAWQAVLQGSWHPEYIHRDGEQETIHRPNIFQLYEENIGTLTPMIADSLKDAEESFPAIWVAEAIQIAVENNKRSWRYISAILDRWDREGKHGGKEKPKNRQDTPESRQRYVDGEFSEFIEH